MKKAYDIGDWVKYKDLPDLHWIYNVDGDNYKTFWVTESGVCYPSWFECSMAKPTTQKAVKDLMKAQLALGDTQFNRWHNAGSAFVDKATRTKWVRKEMKRLEKEAELEAKENGNDREMV